MMKLLIWWLLLGSGVTLFWCIYGLSLRIKRRVMCFIVFLSAILIPLLPVLLLTITCGYASYQYGIPPYPFLFFLIWILAFVLSLRILSLKLRNLQDQKNTSPLRSLLIALLFLTLLILTLQLAYLQVQFSTLAESEQSKQKILSIWPKQVPDQDNAYHYYEQVYEVFDGSKGYPGQSADWITERAGDFYQEHQKTYEILESGWEQDSLYFSLDFSTNGSVQKLLIIRSALNFITPKLSWQIFKNKSPEEIGRTLGLYDRVFSQGIQTPVIITQSSSIVALSRKQAVFENYLNNQNIKINPQLAPYFKIKNFPTEKNWFDCMTYEEAYFSHLLTLDLNSSASFGYNSLIDYLGCIFFLENEFYQQSLFYHKMRAFPEGGTPQEKLADLIRITKETEKKPRSLILTYGVALYQRHYSNFLTPYAYNPLQELAWAVWSYHQKNKVWPASLDNLLPDFLEKIPDDPFGGGTLRMKRTPDGAILYSVGLNGKDNDGIEGTDRDSPEDDIVLLLGDIYREKNLL